MELICIGDSLTFGKGVSRNACWPSLFAQESGWKVVNRGINGDTAAGMLSRLHLEVPALAGRDLSARDACRVIVMGGTNDVFFSGSDTVARSSIAAICHQLAAAGLPPLVGIPLPVDWTYAPEKWKDVVDFHQASLQMLQYIDWLKRYCACSGMIPVDFSADFFRPSGQLRHDLFLDGIHPNGEGHKKMAERLSAALLSR